MFHRKPEFAEVFLLVTDQGVVFFEVIRFGGDVDLDVFVVNNFV